MRTKAYALRLLRILVPSSMVAFGWCGVGKLLSSLDRELQEDGGQWCARLEAGWSRWMRAVPAYTPRSISPSFVRCVILCRPPRRFFSVTLLGETPLRLNLIRPTDAVERTQSNRPPCAHKGGSGLEVGAADTGLPACLQAVGSWPHASALSPQRQSSGAYLYRPERR